MYSLFKIRMQKTTRNTRQLVGGKGVEGEQHNVTQIQCSMVRFFLYIERLSVRSSAVYCWVCGLLFCAVKIFAILFWTGCTIKIKETMEWRVPLVISEKYKVNIGHVHTPRYSHFLQKQRAVASVTLLHAALRALSKKYRSGHLLVGFKQNELTRIPWFL